MVHVQVWDGVEEDRDGLGASVATTGNCDAVHLGHRYVLGVTIAASRATGALAVAVTFDPPPAAVHWGDVSPVLLTGLEDRLALLAETGLDATLVIRYDLAFAA